MSHRRAVARARVQGHESLELSGWEAACAAPAFASDPADIDGLAWCPASVPGTAAAALAESGAWAPSDGRDFDAEDWWFRTSFDGDRAGAGEEIALRFGGLATVAHVYLNGERVLESASMFECHELDVGERLQGHNELAVHFRALAPLLRERRRPRARWRTRVVADGNLRFFRTTMLGRAPGFAPAPAPVGPWRPVSLIRRRQLVVQELRLIPRVVGDDGRLEVTARLRPLTGGRVTSVTASVIGSSGSYGESLAIESTGDGDAFTASGTITIRSVPRWWPHTHGEPELFDVNLVASIDGDDVEVDAGRVGFRALAAGPGEAHNVELDGLDIHLNGQRVFCRGAVWTPVDPVGFTVAQADLRRALELARDAGVNMLRLAGTGVYESESFYDHCDELGLLVWQDFMFANLDYPFADDGFRAIVEREVDQVLGELRGRPSVAVLCGNSEIEQQVGMLGLDPALGRGEVFGGALPDQARAAGIDAVYIPSAPCGGELPFRPDRGVANYFGVGAYLRPIDDARRAGVRFASECLAFSNVPDESGVEQVIPGQPASVVVHDPRWKRGVPRDVGAGWDFEDVRDHYLEQLFGVNARELRSVNHARYLELSRVVTGELMAEVFGEWRRGASPCGGGIVLWWRDLLAGAGWGLIDRQGRPKVAYYHLSRALSPIAVWTIDEGLGGVAIHVANERPAPLRAHLRVALYRDCELQIAEASESIELAAHSGLERSVEGMIGHFVDASWAYRFGPPGHDVIVVSLESPDQPTAPLSQAVRFPVGRPLRSESHAQLGLVAELRERPGGGSAVAIRSKRLVYGIRIHATGYLAADQSFSLEPGHERLVELQWAAGEPASAGETGSAGTPITLTALNLDGALKVT